MVELIPYVAPGITHVANSYLTWAFQEEAHLHYRTALDYFSKGVYSLWWPERDREPEIIPVLWEPWFELGVAHMLKMGAKKAGTLPTDQGVLFEDETADLRARQAAEHICPYELSIGHTLYEYYYGVAPDRGMSFFR